MLQIGKMYLVKKFFWLLYPTKELAGIGHHVVEGMVDEQRAPPRLKELTTAYEIAKWESGQLNCIVDVVEENTCFILLEQDNDYFKLLDSNGNIGWTWGRDFFKHFKLVKE